MSFSLECNPENKLQFNSTIASKNSRVLVLTKDKWLQYNETYMELCMVVADNIQCMSTNLPQSIVSGDSISRVKKVKYSGKTNGYIYI